MNNVDLAVFRIEPLFQQAFNPGSLQGGMPAAECDFKSVLARQKGKTLPGGIVRAEPLAATPDSGELLPDESEKMDKKTRLNERVVFFPVDMDKEPGLADRACVGRFAAAPFSALDSAGELFLFPAMGAGRGFPGEEGGHRIFAQLLSSGEGDPVLFPEPFPRLEEELSEAGPGTIYPKQDLKIAEQAVLGSLTAADLPFAGEAFSLDRAVHRPPGSDPGGSLNDSPKTEMPMSVDAEPDLGDESMGGPDYSSIKTGNVDNASFSGAPGRGVNQGAYTAVSLPAKAGTPADRTGKERFLTAQFPTESTATGDNPNALTGSAVAVQQGPDITDLPGLNRSVFDQLCRCCTAFPERADLPAEIRLALNPPELGEVLIRLASREGKLSVRIIVEAASVKEMLANNLQELFHRFAQSDLHLDGIDLLTAGEMFLDDHRFKKGDYRGQWMNENSSAAILHEGTGSESEPVAGLLHDGIVNYWA